jgi:hypothetical protein
MGTDRERRASRAGLQEFLSNLAVLRGHPLLADAAKYQTLLSNMPVYGNAIVGLELLNR